MRNALSKLGTIVAAALLGVAALVSPVHAALYEAVDAPTFGTVVAAAQPGDTILITTPGTYGAVAPSAGTELHPKVIIGDTGNPRNIVFTSYTPNNHTRLYGVKINALTFSNVKHAMIADCYIVPVIDMQDADSSSIRRCTAVGNRFRIARNVTGGTVADADTLEGNTFTALSASGQMGMEFGDTADGLGDVNSDSCRYFVQRFNVFNISQTGTDPRTPSKHYLTPNFYSYGNKYTITSTSTGAGDEGNYTVLFRDHSRLGVMRRDTILVNNEGGTQSQHGLLWGPGMAGNNGSNFGWQVDSCYIRVYRGACVYPQTRMPGLRFRYNVLRSRLSTAFEFGTGFSGPSDDPYIHHNTLLGKAAVYFAEDTNESGRFSNNILWGTNTASCDAYSAVAGTTGNLTSISDSNFVYSTTADSARAFCKTACASPRTGAWSTTYSNDLHSYWGSPQFSDTSWANLSVQPAAGNFALTATNKWTLGYVGAAATTVVPLSFTYTVDAKANTAGLAIAVTGDIDTTATVAAVYGTGTTDLTTHTWYRLPYTTNWATSLFGLEPSTTYTVTVTVTRAATSTAQTFTFDTRAENWWQQPVKGPLVWIAPLGNDSTGTGAYDAPYRTINKGWAILKAKPNYGKGGGVGLKAGTYYSTGYLDGAEGYATPDSMYHLVGESGAIISGADENVIAANLTWTATGVNGTYKAAYPAADSVGTIVVGSNTLHKCLTRTELLTGAGTGAGGAWTYNAYSWFTNGTDSLYVRTNGSAPSGAMYIAIRPNLVYLLDKYIRVHGISFQFAGGATGNGIALHVGTGGAASYNASGAVIDSCSFQSTTREAIYSFSGTEGNGDSVVVADCSFNSSAYAMGYKATKGRLEESMTPIGADGSSWLVCRNTMSGWGGGPHHNGGAAWTSMLTNDWDLCDNALSLMGDDALELDGAYARNHKVYRNTVAGCNNAVSLAPITGGPAFILHNQLRGYDRWGISSGAFKLGTGSIGPSCGQALIANNTCFGDSLAVSAFGVFDVGEFSNKHFYNNIFQGAAACIYTEYAEYWDTCDLDYNLYWLPAGAPSIAQITDAEGPITVGDLQLTYSLELHGIWTNPAWADTGATLYARGGVDAATRLTGITGFIITTNGSPDIGATEYIATPAAGARRRAWLSVLLRVLGRIH